MDLALMANNSCSWGMGTTNIFVQWNLRITSIDNCVIELSLRIIKLIISYFI